jgi:hypothetical protein
MAEHAEESDSEESYSSGSGSDTLENDDEEASQYYKGRICGYLFEPEVPCDHKHRLHPVQQ